MGYLAVLVFLISVGALAHTSQETRDVPGVPVGGGMGWTGFFILEGFDAGEGLLSRSGQHTIRLLSVPAILGGDVLPGAGRLEWRGTC